MKISLSHLVAILFFLPACEASVSSDAPASCSVTTPSCVNLEPETDAPVFGTSYTCTWPQGDNDHALPDVVSGCRSVTLDAAGNAPPANTELFCCSNVNP